MFIPFYGDLLYVVCDLMTVVAVILREIGEGMLPVVIGIEHDLGDYFAIRYQIYDD